SSLRARPRGLRAAVSRPPRPGAASGIFGTKSGPRQLHDRLGFLAVPRLWGLPDSPQAQAVGFPTHTHRYSESPYGSSPARFPASICSAAWDQLQIYADLTVRSNPLDQHTCALTCAFVARKKE